METKELTLIVSEKKLGSLITNAIDIQNFVKDRIAEYNVDNYTGDEKQAAKDKAELNNAAKKLNDERIALEKEFMQPFQEFKDVVTETTDLIKEASSKLDVIVKAKKQQEDEAKRKELETMFVSLNFTLVSFDKIFNPKWLNKTCSTVKAMEEMNSTIAQINKDLEAIEAFGEDVENMKAFYLSTLNLQMTLNKAAELKRNKERLEEEKRRREEAEKVSNELKEVTEDIKKTVKNDLNLKKEAEIQSNFAENLQKTPQKPVKKEVFYTFDVLGEKSKVSLLSAYAHHAGIEIIPSFTAKATAGQIEEFKKLMAENGMSYDKINFFGLSIK